MTHPSITKIVYTHTADLPNPIGGYVYKDVPFYQVTGKATPHTPVQIHDFHNHSGEGGAVADANGDYLAAIFTLPWQVGHRVNAVMVVGGVPSDPSPPRKLPSHP